MTDREKFELCLRMAQQYQEDCRLEYDPYEMYPQNYVASTTLLTIAIVAMVVAAGVSAYGAYSSAEAQSDALNYQAAVARNNATIATQQGQFDADRIRDRNRRILAAQRNAIAASGIDPGSGSAVDIAADSATQGELEALMAIYTGRVSATSQEAQSRLSSYQAGAAMRAGYVNTAATALSGVSSAASMGTNYNNPTFIR